MDHYYSSKPSSESHRERIEVDLLGRKFLFETDAGVFSKKRVDFGSEVLMATAENVSFPEGDLLDMGRLVYIWPKLSLIVKLKW